jgi:hypothetical protein
MCVVGDSRPKASRASGVLQEAPRSNADAMLNATDFQIEPDMSEQDPQFKTVRASALQSTLLLAEFCFSNHQESLSLLSTRSLMWSSGDGAKNAGKGGAGPSARFVHHFLPLILICPVSIHTVKLLAEYMRLFVLEAAHRAQSQAQAEGDTLIDVVHLEKVLPQLVRALSHGHEKLWIQRN